MTILTEALLLEGSEITLSAIVVDLNSNEFDALYYAREDQINELIESGRIDEDFASKHQDYQEELRYMINGF